MSWWDWERKIAMFEWRINQHSVRQHTHKFRLINWRRAPLSLKTLRRVQELCEAEAEFQWDQNDYYAMLWVWCFVCEQNPAWATIGKESRAEIVFRQNRRTLGIDLSGFFTLLSFCYEHLLFLICSPFAVIRAEQLKRKYNNGSYNTGTQLAVRQGSYP